MQIDSLDIRNLHKNGFVINDYDIKNIYVMDDIFTNVLKEEKISETSKSGIFLPVSDKEKPQIAEVVAVGPGTEEIKMEIKVGDKVIINKYSGTEVKYEGTEYTIVKQEDVLAIVD